MAPLYIEEGDAFCYAEEDASTATESTSSSSLSSDDELSASPLQTPLAMRSVSFSAGAAVHCGAVLNIDDYSEHEKFECWFQADEMRQIRREVKDTLSLMNRNLIIDENCKLDGSPISIRGLEGKTKAGKRHRRETRLASLAAVFDEQTLQEMDGVTDPLMIALAYSEYSYPMQVAAFQRASIYQKEAIEIYDSSEDKIEYPCAPSKVSAIDEIPAEPTKYDFENNRSTEAFNNLLEVDETEDDSSFKKEDSNVYRNEETSRSGSGNIYDDLELFQNRINNRKYNNIGALRIRDRFACLLPGSAVANRRPIMGALRVVHI